MTISKEALGKGGEGSVFTVVNHTMADIPQAGELVAKIYHSPEEGNRLKKIVAMLKSPPDSESLAWPVALLLTESGKFQGYLMKKLPMEKYRMWASFTQGAERKKTSENFDVRYAFAAILNLAIALEAVHDAGHFVGDVNESNIFVGNDAGVLLVDTDSAQISTNSGEVFPCLVGKPEYTAAELVGSFKDNQRTEATDTFAFAVAAYQLLMNGAHPTDGIYKGTEDPPAVGSRIRAGVLPNLRKEKMYEPVPRVPSVGLPKAIVPVFIAMLSPEPSARPRLHEVMDSVEDVINNLQRCSKVKQHWYDKRDRKCGWCEHVKKGNVDTWTLNLNSKQKRQQKKLQELKFQDTSSSATSRAPRASITPQGAQQNSPRRQTASTATRSRIGGASRRSQAASQHRAPNMALPQEGAAVSDYYQSSRISMPTHKGKTILSYADGSQRPRPPLGSMLEHNPKMAYQCFVNELPGFLRLHWSVGRKAPTMSNVIMGLLAAGALLYYLTGYLVGIILDMIPLEYTSKVPAIVDAVPSVLTLISLFAMAIYAGSAFREIRSMRKAGVLPKMFATTAPVESFGRIAAKGLVYGPLFLVIGPVMLISVLMVFGSAIAQSSNR